MYLGSTDDVRVRWMAQQQLDGFNPLKALGRAIGSTGRAIIGAVAPGVSQVLDVAAKAPPGTTTIAPVASVAPSATAQPGTAPPNVASDSSASKAPVSNVSTSTAMDQLIANLAARTLYKDPGGVVMSPPPQGVPNISITSPSGAPMAGAAMPPWLIPAGIGALALVFLMQRSHK